MSHFPLGVTFLSFGKWCRYTNYYQPTVFIFILSVVSRMSVMMPGIFNYHYTKQNCFLCMRPVYIKTPTIVGDPNQLSVDIQQIMQVSRSLAIICLPCAIYNNLSANACTMPSVLPVQQMSDYRTMPDMQPIQKIVNYRKVSIMQQIGNCRTRPDLHQIGNYRTMPVMHQIANYRTMPVMQQISNQQTSVNDVIFEINDRYQRSFNVIIYNIEESKSKYTRKQILEDKKKTLQVLNSLPNIELEPQNIKVFRIGQPNGNKNRPLRVCFENHIIPTMILNQKKQISRGHNLRVSSDRTIMQHNELKQLRKELHCRLQKGETNLTIKYINQMPYIVSK